MIKRFHIEDLITQDPWGVIFRAVDKESGNTVAVRRFFPFGADGGGLNPDDQPVYQNAVRHLAELSHPALRAVVCGGCDPVDAMPYIATEWIEGSSVREYLEHGPLPAEAAIELVTQALEVSEVLSVVLGEEQVWVETDLQTIIVGNAESGRGFTFWMSPLKWVGGHERGKGLWPIVRLTEEVMGWQNRNVSDDAGYGLGGWLQWLRLNAGRIGLQDARETLAASIGVEPPPPAQKLVSQASRPQVAPLRVKTTPAYGMWVVNVVLGIGAAGLLVWFYLQQQAQNRELTQIRSATEVSPSALREAALRRVAPTPPAANDTSSEAQDSPPPEPDAPPPPARGSGPATAGRRVAMDQPR